MTYRPLLIPEAHCSLRKVRGEYRVAFRPHVVQLAHQQLLGRFASQQVCNARIEATAYYTTSRSDALETRDAMLRRAFDYPQSLIAERDLPRSFNPQPAEAAAFQRLLLAQQAAGAEVPNYTELREAFDASR